MGTRHAPDGRPLPWVNPTTRPFFDGARGRKLLLQRCPRDGCFHYPRSHCPTCLGDDWQWVEASGRGVVHSFTIDRAGHHPALAKLAPYAIAIVELEEGPRMTARLVDCDVEKVRVGLPVVAAFEDAPGATLVHFRPA
jgi:hypothetical protein